MAAIARVTVSVVQHRLDAIVEASTTTVLLRRGDRAEVTPLGWLDVAVGEHPGKGDVP